MVDGWDMIQRPSVWHPGASAMSAAPGSPPFLPPPPSRCAGQSINSPRAFDAF